MPAASALSVDNRGTGLPSGPRYMSRVAAAGAFSRASIITLRLSLARCTRMNPPPPSPDPLGSTTASAALTATAASKALPPFARISIPASVARGCAVVIAALPGASAAGSGRARKVARNATRSLRIGFMRRACRTWNSRFAGDTGAQGFGDQRMHELAHVAAKARDLADQRRGDEIEPLRRREEHGLDLVGEMPVHRRELELEFEVRHGAQPADDHVQPVLDGEIYREPGVAGDLDFGQVGEHGTRERHPLI